MDGNCNYVVIYKCNETVVKSLNQSYLMGNNETLILISYVAISRNLI